MLVAAQCGDQDTFSCLLEHVSQLVVREKKTFSAIIHKNYYYYYALDYCTQVAGNEEDTENIVSRFVA